MTRVEERHPDERSFAVPRGHRVQRRVRLIEVEGEPSGIAELARRLVDKAPPMARVGSVTSEVIELGADESFRIADPAWGRNSLCNIRHDWPERDINSHRIVLVLQANFACL